MAASPEPAGPAQPFYCLCGCGRVVDRSHPHQSRKYATDECRKKESYARRPLRGRIKRVVKIRRAAGKPDTHTEHWRPKLRAECPETRPCPYVGCRYNLYLEVLPSGHISLTWPGKEPEDVTTCSCALDFAEEGEHTLEEVADELGLTRERVRQVEDRALAKVESALASLGVPLRPAGP